MASKPAPKPKPGGGIDPGAVRRLVRRDRRGGFNWRGWTTLAFSVVSASAAVTFKEEADAAYQSYQDSAIPETMDYYLDEANRYDRYATVAWVVAEVSFLASLWFFAQPMLGLEKHNLAPELGLDGGETRLGMSWRY